MNAPIKSPYLDDILDDFALADPNPSDVAEWVARYPRFADDIRAFAESWFAMEELTEDEVEVFEEQDTLLQNRELFIEKGIAIMRQRLDDIEPAPAPQSLPELLSLRGFTAPELREILGLSRRFWSSLTRYPIIRGRPKAEAIWERIISTFAYTLDAPREWVADAFDANAASSLSFSKADTRPVSGEAVDLEELVRDDNKLASQTRTYFLTGEGLIPGTAESDESLD